MASLQTRLSELITTIKTETKALRTLISGSNTGNISGLNTTNKASLVAAINEVKVTADSASGATGNTNLTITKSATINTILSDTGTDAIITLADGSNAGLLSPSEKTKLATVLLSGNNLSDIGNAATTRSNLGLGNVDNTSDINKPVSIATATALSNKADLVGGFIPASQIPGSYDDVIDIESFVSSNPSSGMTIGNVYYNTVTNQLFTATSATAGTTSTPEKGKLYTRVDNLTTYRWSGTVLAPTNAGLALGTTSTTAYRGDFGNTAYLHSQITDGTNPHNTTFANLSSKPTTISGFGITDAYTKTELGDPDTDLALQFTNA